MIETRVLNPYAYIAEVGSRIRVLKQDNLVYNLLRPVTCGASAHQPQQLDIRNGSFALSAVAAHEGQTS